jgi:transcriptional regulator with XRE-family HTH domain
MRDREGWSQQELARNVGMNQNAVSRLENPSYGKPTITTLKRLAASFDVALVVRFVPFSQLIDWVSGTPLEDKGLSNESLAPVSFGQESEVILGRIPDNVSVVAQAAALQLGPLPVNGRTTSPSAASELIQTQSSA